MTDTDDQLRQHYRKLELPEHSLQNLTQAYEGASSSKRSSWWHRYINVGGFQHRAWVASIASVALVLVVAFAFRFGLSLDRSEQLLKEVALNHATRFEPDVQAGSLEELDEQMALLPFNLQLPQSIDENYQVRGARYCSLSGQLSVHVELTHKTTGKVASVFLTRAADELSVIGEQARAVDGINMRIWRDSGYFYVWAGSNDIEV